MKKIFYPVLLLALTACKGNQQTTDTESVTVPVSEVAAETPLLPQLQSPTKFHSTGGLSSRLNVRQPSL